MKIAPLVAGSLICFTPVAFAQAPDLSKECSAEISKYCPDAKTDAEITNCIEKREQMGKKKAGLSKRCYDAHEKLESPEHEKGEHPAGDHGK